MISNFAGLPLSGKFTTGVTLVHGTSATEPEFYLTGSRIEVTPAANGKIAHAAETPMVEATTNLLPLSVSQQLDSFRLS